VPGSCGNDGDDHGRRDAVAGQGTDGNEARRDGTALVRKTLVGGMQRDRVGRPLAEAEGDPVHNQGNHRDQHHRGQLAQGPNQREGRQHPLAGDAVHQEAADHALQ
jgi:hypothetical protein